MRDEDGQRERGERAKAKEGREGKGEQRLLRSGELV